MRKVGICLVLVFFVAMLPAARNPFMEDFFFMLLDSAFPFNQAKNLTLKEDFMQSWIESVLPWESPDEKEISMPLAVPVESEEIVKLEEQDPVIEPKEEQEKFLGIPADLFVKVRDLAAGFDLEELKSRYNQALINQYDKTVSLYNYDSDTVRPSPEFIDGETFMETDVSLDSLESDGPLVLIFHTHGTEGFVGKEEYGILDVGDYLAEILENQYGISVLHHKGIYDAEGVNGAYTRMSEEIPRILEANPSIQVAIDMHRDGVSESTHLVSNVNGKETAKIMLVTGVSRAFDENGDLQVIDYLPNENLPSVLALGFQLKMAADTVYPGFMRPLYLSSWRYSTYMLPRSMLLEVGAQTNTLEEAKAAMIPFAQILVTVLKG